MSRTAPVRVAVVVGSVREGRFGPTAAEWFADSARNHEAVEVDLIDLAEAGVPERLVEEEKDTPDEVRALGARLARADAFVLVTPEYNRSFPASLKTAIDWFQEAWKAKPAGFVSYGGVTGGRLAVEQLRLIMAELQVITVRDALCFPNYWEQFDVDGNWPKDAKEAGEAAEGMLDQLTWWARALRTHREVVPYPA